MISRRGLLGFIAASPFIVKAASLMPIKMLKSEIVWHYGQFPIPGTYARYSGYDVLNLTPADILSFESLRA